MAISLASVGALPASPWVPGYLKRGLFTVTFDNSYTTGGYALTAALTGLNRLDCVLVSGSSLVGRTVTYVDSTGKLKVYVSSTGVEVGNGVDLSADKIVVEVIGV